MQAYCCNESSSSGLYDMTRYGSRRFSHASLDWWLCRDWWSGRRGEIPHSWSACHDKSTTNDSGALNSRSNLYHILCGCCSYGARLNRRASDRDCKQTIEAKAAYWYGRANSGLGVDGWDCESSRIGCTCTLIDVPRRAIYVLVNTGPDVRHLTIGSKIVAVVDRSIGATR